MIAVGYVDLCLLATGAVVQYEKHQDLQQTKLLHINGVDDARSVMMYKKPWQIHCDGEHFTWRAWCSCGVKPPLGFTCKT